MTPLYYYEALVLLGVPTFIAGFFSVLLVVFLCVVFFEYRRNRHRNLDHVERFEDDEQAHADEIAETYMNLL